MIELFTWPTPNRTKPSIMLEEVGAPYSVHFIILGSGEQHAPQFLTVSPNGKIPAIVDHNGVVPKDSLRVRRDPCVARGEDRQAAAEIGQPPRTSDVLALLVHERRGAH